ncbi:MAG TPA: TonB-dependent receptor [Ferruginibacter sp.]|nr:TonB-dependent receptor [Ferruginibacter sp.]
MFKLLFSIFLSVVSFSGMAQYSLSGVVVDADDKSPVQGATVSLYFQKDSSIVANTVTTTDGEFIFQNLATDSFFVSINALSHQAHTVFATITNKDKNFGVLNLYKKGKDLAGVTVTATGSPVVNKADTTQYSASQYKVNPDATTEDLIKKMPGITVAKDGTVTAQGETVKKVTIDGKDFFGDDASAALKNMPSEVVDKIQVFDKLSDQAQLTGVDDGNSVKAINVVTKSGIKNGQFGRAYAGYGTDERYAAGGNVSFFNGDRRVSIVANLNNVNQQNFGSQDLLGVTGSGGGGGRGGGRMFGGSDNFTVGQQNGISRTNAFGINYNDKWGKNFTLSGSYFYNSSKLNTESDIKAQILDRSGKWYKDNSNSTSFTNNTNHRINFRAEYKIDSNNSIFIIPSLSFQANNANGISNGQTFYGANDSLNTSMANTIRGSSGYNIRNRVMFRHSFANRRRSLSVGFNTTFTRNSSENILDGRYRFFDDMGNVTDSLPNQFYDNLTNGTNYEGNLTYTEPLGKSGMLQFEYNPSIQKNKADQQTFHFDNGKYTAFDTSLSNKFDNTVTTQNGGISYRYNPNRDNMLMFGLNFQNSNLQSDRIFPTVTNVDQSFFNLLPRLMFRKKFNSSNNLWIFYRARVNFPSVTQLQDVVNLSDPLRVSMGNSLLKQAYTNFISTRYSFANSKSGKSFFANLFAQTTSDYISNATYLLNADSTLHNNIVLKAGSQLVKPVNLDGYKNIRTMFTYTFPVKFIKSNLSINTGAGYSKMPSLTNNLPVTTNNYTYNAGVSIASNISEYVDFNVSYSANFNNATTKSAVIASKNNFVNQTMGLQLNLLNKKGWFIQNDVSNQSYTGLSTGLNQSFWLWNAGIGKKFLKNNAAELKLTVFDLLKQNQSITRTVSANYIEDARYNVLEQYFMLTFTYNLKNFGKGKSKDSGDGRPMGMPPYGGGHGPSPAGGLF